ncbi:MAG: D-glycero-beta-D-manno-heptose 1-phosphate adenylyltransferase [Ferruginibacter sp.]|nr:D-glycero-beta-D-manno-heptose 1-phosphate adenylyltransferase [Cytophagales bacterium]
MNPRPTTDKIVALPEAIIRVKVWQSENQEVVFTNGCFDILHAGHVDYLEKARHLGGKLVVGVNTDHSVKRLKGASRPVVDEQARTRIIAALSFVDLVILFDEDTPICLIESVGPDILVKGDDYSVATIVGADFVINRGGRVMTVPLVAGWSTSRIIEKIKSTYGSEVP